MALGIGDAIPSECTPVANLPFAMLDGTSGSLQMGTYDDKLPISDNKTDFTDEFLSNSLTVCNSRGEFCRQGYPLMVDVLVAAECGCYTIYTNADDLNRMAGTARITRTTDGVLWCIFAASLDMLPGLDGAGVMITKSTNSGVTWSTPIEVATVPGTLHGGAVVADQDDLMHIFWSQTERTDGPNGWLSTDPSVINLHYRTYDGVDFDDEILLTDLVSGPSYSPSADFPRAVIDGNNDLHLVFVGQGIVDPEAFEEVYSIEYIKNPTGLGENISLTESGFEYIYYPEIATDPNNDYHVVYLADTELRYIGPEISGAYELILSSAFGTTFCVLPVIYADTSVHYDPFLFTLDMSVVYHNRIVEVTRGEGGWDINFDGIFSGTPTAITGGGPPNGDESEPLRVTIPGHSLENGDIVRLTWDGASWALKNTDFTVAVVDKDTVEFVGTETVANNSGSNNSWTMDVGRVQTMCDASNNLRLLFNTDTQVYIVAGTPGAWEAKELITTDRAPSPVQLNQVDTGQFVDGYIFTKSLTIGPDFGTTALGLCICITEPD